MKVLWTRLALSDLTHAHDYISKERPSSAGRIIERIESAVQAIGRHPEIGRPGRLEGARELMVPGTPFIVPYRVKAAAAEVLAVIHGKRRWPDRI